MGTTTRTWHEPATHNPLRGERALKRALAEEAAARAVLAAGPSGLHVERSATSACFVPAQPAARHRPGPR